MTEPGGRTLLFVQYGAFRDDLRRLADGGPETYQAQRRSVEMIGATAAHGWATVVVNPHTDDRHDEAVAPGLRVIGLGADGARTGWRGWWRLLEAIRPARIVLRTPLLPVLAWAARRRVPVLAMLADSFHGGGPRGALKRLALRRLLGTGAVAYVGNHGRNATFQLAALGVPAAKLIPYDWVSADSPHAHPAKSAPPATRPLRLAFVGALTEAKGADDLVRATALLGERGVAASLTMIGGEPARLEALARSLGVADRVAFLGRVPADAVVPQMRAADVVVVPSRHEYPEGLPLTIYAALSSRSPIVASDHPMFLGNLVAGESALIFRAGDAAALAGEVARLAADPGLYARLSANGAAAWDRLQLPGVFEEVVERWLAGDRAWLDALTLARRDYRAAAPGAQ